MLIEPVHQPKQGDNPLVVCDNFLHARENLYIVTKKWQKTFLDTLKIMDSCIRDLMANKEVSEFDYAPIEQCLNYLTNITIEKEESPSLMTFINNYIHLAHNINENTIKNNTIRKKISYLKRYADRSLTMAESMSLMRQCSLRLARFKEIQLPTYRLSQHYYTTIKEG